MNHSFYRKLTIGTIAILAIFSLSVDKRGNNREELILKAHRAINSHKNFIEKLNNANIATMKELMEQTIDDQEFLSINNEDLPYPLNRTQAYIRQTRRGWERFLPQWSVEFQAEGEFHDEYGLTEHVDLEKYDAASKEYYRRYPGNPNYYVAKLYSVADYLYNHPGEYFNKYYSIYFRVDEAIQNINNAERSLKSFENYTEKG